MKSGIKRILQTMLITVFAVSVIMVVGCSESNREDISEKGISESEELSEQSVVGTCKFLGEEEINLKAETNVFDFTKTVKAESLTGKQLDFEIVYNDVKLGEAGEYRITYECEGVKFNQTVKIYSMPTIEIEESATGECYYDTFDKYMKDNVKGKDSFNNELTVSLSSIAKERIYDGGLIKVGSYEIEYAVVDKAGNVAYKKSQITIKKCDNAPIITSVIQADVSDDEIVLEVETHSQPILFVKVGNERLAYRYESETVKIDAQEVYEKIGIDGVKIYVVTSKGYDAKTLKVLDENNPELDTYGLNDWVYKVNSEAELPQIGKKYKNQSYEIKTKLYDMNGEYIASDVKTFTPTQVGKYKLKVIPVKNGIDVTESTKDINLIVYGEQEYTDLYASGTSLQKRDELKLIEDTEIFKQTGGYVDYGYTEELGTGAYTLYAKQVNAWKGYWLGRNISTKYKKVVFDLYYVDEEIEGVNGKYSYLSVETGNTKHLITGNADWSGGYGNYLDSMSVYEIDENGEFVRFVNPKMTTDQGKGIWLRVECCIDAYRDPYCEDRILVLNEYAGRFYIRNVRYSEEDIWKEGYDPDSYYNYLSYGDYSDGIGKCFKYDTTWGSSGFVGFTVVKQQDLQNASMVSFDMLYEDSILFILYCGKVAGNDYPNKVIWPSHTEDHANYSNMKIRAILDSGEYGAPINPLSNDTTYYGKWMHVEFLIPNSAEFVNFKFESLDKTIYFKNITVSNQTEFSKITMPDEYEIIGDNAVSEHFLDYTYSKLIVSGEDYKDYKKISLDINTKSKWLNVKVNGSKYLFTTGRSGEYNITSSNVLQIKPINEGQYGEMCYPNDSELVNNWYHIEILVSAGINEVSFTCETETEFEYKNVILSK